MAKHEINRNEKDDSTVEDLLNEGEEILESVYQGTTQILRTGYTCDYCGDEFDDEDARNGHMASCDKKPEDTNDKDTKTDGSETDSDAGNGKVQSEDSESGE